MENKKVNPLVVFLIIVILVLCATIGFLFVYNKNDESENKPGVNENNPGTNVDEPTNPILQDVSLDDADVKKIIENFKITTYDWEINTYIYEKVKDEQLLDIAYINSENLINEESNCNYPFYGDLTYTCKYIKYADFNKNYKMLTGRDLTKTDLSIYLIELIYDASMDAYKICNVPAGGGPGPLYLSKVDKVTADDNYMYVYEKVAFIDETSNYYDPLYLRKPHLYDENYEYTGEDILLGTSEQVDPYKEEDKNKIIEENINKFDTYKWTFKKDLNGNYIYEKLEYVTQ